MNDLKDIAGVLSKARRVLICGHVMPDGDCVGSVGALGLALKQLKKEVIMSLPDPVPGVFSFLPGVSDFVIGSKASKALDKEYDTFVVLDCPVPERLGILQRVLNRNLVVCSMDHHASYRCFAHYNYINPDSAATAEIIQDLLNLMDIKITPEIATYLYTGIVTDTGSFQYENTKPDTHRRVAMLMELGAPSVMINIMLHEQKPLAYFRVLEAALSTLSLSPCGHVAWMSITRELLDRLDAKDEHAEGLINYARSVRGVEVALLFREISPGRYKIGFRSKGVVDVNRLAARFGGGGHIRAAGCILEGDLDTLQSKIVNAALEAVAGEVK